MFQVEIYGRVRRAVRVEGRSQRAVAREFRLSRDMLRKMLQYAVPSGYQRQQPIKRPRLGPCMGVIDAILSDDKQRPVKQRHTAKRIFNRLKDKHQFEGGYTIVMDYVRSARIGSALGMLGTQYGFTKMTDRQADDTVKDLQKRGILTADPAGCGRRRARHRLRADQSLTGAVYRPYIGRSDTSNLGFLQTAKIRIEIIPMPEQ